MIILQPIIFNIYRILWLLHFIVEARPQFRSLTVEYDCNLLFEKK